MNYRALFSNCRLLILLQSKLFITVEIVAAVAFVSSLFFLIRHYLYTPLSGDDLSYFIHQTFSVEYVSSRYFQWSGRVLIDSIIPFFTVNLTLYRLVIILSILLLTVSLKKVVMLNIGKHDPATKTLDSDGISQMMGKEVTLKSNSGSVYLLSALTVLMLPFYEMETAGFVATTANYLLPLTTTVISYSLLLNRNEKISIIEGVALTLFCLFSCNHEQFAVVLALLAFLNLKVNSKINKRAVLVLITAIFSLVFIFTCPGNALRLISETQYWMPEFAHFSIYDKVKLGVGTTLYHLVYKNNLPFLFCFACFLYAASDRYLIVIAGLGFMAVARMIVRSDLKHCDFEHIADSKSFFTCFSLQSSVILFILAILLFLLAFFIRVNVYKKISFALVIAVAFGLRAVIGFSPTVFASGVRPAIISQSIFIISGFVALMVSKADFKKSYILVTLFAVYNFSKFIYPLS